MRDTMVAGDFKCKKSVVEFVIKEGVERLEELINWGAEFDKNLNTEYYRHLERKQIDSTNILVTAPAGEPVPRRMLVFVWWSACPVFAESKKTLRKQ